MITSEQVRAARALLRWEQKQLSETSGVSLPSIKRLEVQPGPLAAHPRTVQAIRGALEAAGVTFIPPQGGGAGVRLTRHHEYSLPGEDEEDVAIYDARMGELNGGYPLTGEAAPAVNSKKP